MHRSICWPSSCCSLGRRSRRFSKVVDTAVVRGSALSPFPCCSCVHSGVCLAESRMMPAQRCLWRTWPVSGRWPARLVAVYSTSDTRWALLRSSAPRSISGSAAGEDSLKVSSKDTSREKVTCFGAATSANATPAATAALASSPE